MRWLVALCLVACTGDPVGEAPSSGGAAGSGGSSGAGGSAGSAASSGSAGAVTSGVLDPGPDGAEGIAVDATHVYYGKGAELWSVAKSGGTPAPISSGQVLVREVVVDAESVYFLDGDKTIRRAPKSGGAATMLAQGAGGFEEFGDIATDGVHVYYSSVDDKTSFSGAIRRVKITGGVPDTIHTIINAAEPRGVYLHAGAIYWANHLGGSLYKEEIAGGSPTLLELYANKPWRVAANDSHVYWTETDGSLGFKKYGGIYMVVEAGGPGTDVVIDEQNVYFSSRPGGQVYATSIEPDVASLIGDCSLAGALAVDESAVYVACAGGSPGAVLRIAK